jgi:hypothetical protein
MQPERKPARAATRRVTGTSSPLPAVRKRVWEAACELVTAGSHRDIAGVLANRFSLSKRAVNAILVAEGMRHERIGSALFLCCSLGR